MLNHTTQAVLLLTAHFSKPSAGDPKPLSPTEWGRFAMWLKEQGRTPEELMVGEPSSLLTGWADEKITAERIGMLLSRSSALALALEKWQRAGLWVVTRSDPDYPHRLKKHLRNSSPPLFFGCGNRHLMNRGGLAVVGSRNASAADLDFARRLGAETAAAGYSVVSGGARGVDESAMLGTLEKQGTVIGVMADRLLKEATSAKFRPALMAGDLVLMSPFNPEAGFDVGNAMARNKYVYCLADAAVVVHSETKGGTWSGAIENLKHGWVPLWVKPSSDGKSGNSQLVAKGARWLPGDGEQPDIGPLVEKPDKAELPPEAEGLFGTPLPSTGTAVGEDQSEFEPGSGAAIAAEHEDPVEASGLPAFEISEPSEAKTGVAGTDGAHEKPSEESDEWEAFKNMTFYDFFLRRIETLTSREAKTVEELSVALDISKAQLNAWLKRATEEGKLKKTAKPRLRYAWLSPEPKPKQASIF